MKHNTLAIYDTIIDKNVCEKFEYTRQSLRDIFENPAYSTFKRVFDSDLYYSILKQFYDPLHKKFRLWKFLSEDKIIHKLRVYINNFIGTSNGKKSFYEYEFTLKARIELTIFDNYHTEYMVIIEKMNKHGPYTWY